MGFVYFAAAKYAGYTFFCGWPIAAYRQRTNLSEGLPSVWMAGAVRTGIGLAVGVPLGIAYWALMPNSNSSMWLFFLGLVPVRVLEWWLLLTWIYRRCEVKNVSKDGMIAGGVVASFVLDAIGVFGAMVLPGGMWVC